MRHYELVTILSPMLNQDEASATWDEIKAFISNRDGEITAEQVWGTRRLAYPIRKGNYNFLEGSYYLSSFTVENAFNRELENYLRLDERVLRSLVVRCEGPLPDRPAPGPLTAPSRYIPPGRGRRPDGGGPIPEAPGSFSDRRGGPPPADAPAAPAPATSDAPVSPAPATSDAPVSPAPATSDAPVSPARATSDAPVSPAPATSDSPVSPAPATSDSPVSPAPAASDAPATPAADAPAAPPPAADEAAPAVAEAAPPPQPAPEPAAETPAPETPSEPPAETEA